MNKTIGPADGGGLSATGPFGTDGPQPAVVRPAGISPAIRKAPDEDWFRGNQWPPENTEPPNGAPAPWQPNAARHFTPVVPPALPPGSPVEAAMPPRGWSPAWFAIVLLTEFAQAWKPAAATQTALQTRLAAALTPAQQAAERAELIALIEFRAGLLAEATAQMVVFDQYFQGALGFTAASHPGTDYLVEGALQAATFVSMYYKNMFQRPRPWQLWPELMPPVAVPGHASYPSGHATQAHTIAKVLQAVAKNAAPSAADIAERMAQRIRRGREVLGLHYPSDSAAGEFLSIETAAVFLACPTVVKLVAAAQAEWQSFAI